MEDDKRHGELAVAPRQAKTFALYLDQLSPRGGVAHVGKARCESWRPRRASNSAVWGRSVLARTPRFSL